MRRKLHLFTLLLVLFTLGSNAQDHVWDLSNDVLWPASNANAAGYVRDGLTVGPANGNFRMQASSVSGFSDSYIAAKGFFFPSGSTVSGNLPTDNFFAIPVTGPCTLSIWASATNVSRRVYVSDGTNLLLTGTFSGSVSPFLGLQLLNYTGGAGTLYVYASSQLYIYKMSVVFAPLSTNDFKAESSVGVYVDGGQVFVSNVKSNTTVSVYTVTGALVKTVEAGSDISFNLGSGLYVAKVKSAEGEKSVKLLMK